MIWEEILDQLNSLLSDAFLERSKLRDRQNELGRLLQGIEIPGSEAIERRWSEATAKSALEELADMIVSPMESGSGGGGWVDATDPAIRHPGSTIGRVQGS